MKILSKLSTIVGPLLGVYLAFKLGDMFIRGTFIYLTEFSTASVMFVIELVVGVIIPLRMFFSDYVRHSQLLLFIASCLVVFGVLLNRINNFIVAYNPPYSFGSYFPSFGEISLTVGFAALLVLIYRFIVINFPVISREEISVASKRNIQ